MQSPTRLLIVEDECIVADDLRTVLEELGYVVTGTATTSDEALQALSEQPTDLVLLDIRLPGDSDGIHLASLLRERHDLPVVFLTANTDQQTIDRALATAPGGYISKPFNERTLRATIELALRHHAADIAQRRTHAEERARWVQQNSELKDLAERFRRESTIDPLTGLHNRRHLDAVIKRELSLAKREGRALGLILFDLDRFKVLNDTFGHSAGDSALQAIGSLLRSRLRSYDVACRYGGEEIVILLPGAQIGDASALAEQLRLGIQELVVEYAGVRVQPLTASFGVSAFPSHGLEFESLLRAADAALYVSKAAGRNRVSRPPNALSG